MEWHHSKNTTPSSLELFGHLEVYYLKFKLLDVKWKFPGTLDYVGPIRFLAQIYIYQRLNSYTSKLYLCLYDSNIKSELITAILFTCIVIHKTARFL